MKTKIRPLAAMLLACALLLAGCSAGQGSGDEEQPRLTVLATTYPVYLFASAVTEGVEGIRVERLSTGQVSCLHDYTLSVDDMKKIERADVIAMNGAELEEFMEDALAASDAAVIDCSQGVELLENLEHHHEGEDHDDHDGHDHGHWDPHYWMDPQRAAQMVGNLVRGLTDADSDNGDTYRDNGQKAFLMLNVWDEAIRDLLNGEEMPEITGLITFHDGFQYFAQTYGLPLLAAIEEEAGSEASAKEINEITALVKEKNIPVIFTEVNGSDATAKAIARETGCAVAQLSMCMDGSDGALSNYYDALMGNVTAIINGFAGEELVR